MNKTKLLMCVAAVSCGALPAFADGQREAHYPRAPIVGVWQLDTTVRVNADDCTTAQAVPSGPNPFSALYTFHDGGTLSEHGSRSGPAFRGPGHGVWRRVGYRVYEARSIFLRYDANGFLSGTFEMTTEFLVAKGGDSLSAVSRFAVTDLSGNTLRFCATSDGVRFAL